MRTVFSPSDLITRFNNHIRFYPDCFYEYSIDNVGPQQKVFSLVEPCIFDLIVVGPCSEKHMEDPVPFIMEYSTISGQNSMNNILVLPGCCGDYEESIKARLKAINPNINWIVPAGVPDFRDSEMTIDILARFLVKLKLVKITDREEVVEEIQYFLTSDGDYM